MTLENYSEPEGVGLCRNCGRECDDHIIEQQFWHTRGTTIYHFCPDSETGSEFEERDADWYAEREASRRER